ncbi:site-specific DNA-methyltransferase [Alloacidobacterium dinghuense]|uniref:Methyltransferase n=1 Tax=Alloacidobacterium dinghuense TaxID=2763107 RepID=A0A7G8BF77_9BACT|nr:site-specific DNA-methyltransferase [Alloacidobacterium dinghuense]QNI31197.1 site-specific DNA-methyltransferase [Alloacidobacterium dinghuense]
MRQAIERNTSSERTANAQEGSVKRPYVELVSRAQVSFLIPLNDADPGALEIYREANNHYRTVPWPAPFDKTTHRLRLGDARDLSWIPDSSVHLVVTSPPYWTLKEYVRDNQSQLGDIADYEQFLVELDKVWRHCARVLVPGGRICCVVGDICVSRKRGGRHHVMPLHADIQVRSRKLGLDCLTPILWQKITNGATEAEGNGAGFYGKPYQPGSIVKNDTEFILLLRKGGEYRSAEPVQKVLSMLTKDEMQGWLRSGWADLPGASTTKSKHPAPYPIELAERLIKLFSFAGDTILDPFLGTGSTTAAAIRTGRNSIGIEIEPSYLEVARQKISALSRVKRMAGATSCEVICG